jgi:hypothetical protein
VALNVAKSAPRVTDTQTVALLIKVIEELFHYRIVKITLLPVMHHYRMKRVTK